MCLRELMVQRGKPSRDLQEATSSQLFLGSKRIANIDHFQNSIMASAELPLPYTLLEPCTLAVTLPPELLFDVVDITLAENIHAYMVDDEEPEWDALKVLLQANSMWRDIAGNIISTVLGIDRDEAGK